MRLLPREEDRLLLFLAAELARRRRERGLRLSQAEASALIADAVCEAARDGRPYADVGRRGLRARSGRTDVLDGVAGARAAARGRGAARPTARGWSCCTIRSPRARLPAAAAGEPAWDAGEAASSRSSTRATSRSASPRTCTSSRSTARCASTARAAWGMRLALPGRREGVLRAGRAAHGPRCCPFGGRRVIRGHGGLCDGPLDAPGAREAALELARERGYRGA